MNIYDQPAHIYILFEHQSSVDELMAYRKLKYVGHAVDRHIAKSRDNKVSPIPLPLVIPVLMHHSESGWTARTNVQELYHPAFTSNPIFAPYIPHLPFVLDDISHISDDALRQRAWRLLPTLAVLVLRDGRSPERLIAAADYWHSAFYDLAEATSGIDALSIIFRYLEQVAPKALVRFFKALDALSPSKQESTVTFTEIFNEKARAHALAEGELKGKLEGQVAVLLRQLNRKFGDLPPAIRDRVTDASTVELDQWTDNILSAASIDDVFGP